MIRVESIEDIPQPARDRIKAKVMRRFMRHLQDRPEISDETLRFALGFDRTTLATLVETLGARADAGPPHGAALGAAQASMLNSMQVSMQAPLQASVTSPLARRADENAPVAIAARAGGCCGGGRRD